MKKQKEQTARVKTMSQYKDAVFVMLNTGS